ncbi:MAG: PSD1 and planctomycete cytochrome C domain-containing protein [Verrucomicrobiota bacterium]
MIAGWFCLVGVVAASSEPTEGEKLFALHVKPLFAEKCAACHGDDPGKIKGGFDMRSREAMLLGGDFFGEEVLMPGKGEESFLYLVSTRGEEDYEMPPKESDKLTEEQLWWIRDWINEGAPWPDDERVAAIQEEYAEGEQVATSLALSEDWQNRRYEPEKLWAYRPLAVSEVPEGWHPVDYFIDDTLAEVGLSAAGDAGPVSMARRMAFGLTGLPPASERLESFSQEYASDPESAVLAYGEELMSSIHYAERFGGHWLDVVRYADTAGYANDYSRPNAWRYRDYVIRSFHEDKPYPQFVREQLAGDLVDAKDSENLIATGFLRMGPWEHTSMSVFAEMRQKWLDDITDSVGQTFLAHAMQCAKCHDHKFDPVPTRDYYQMMAVFSTTQFAERYAPFLPEENQKGFETVTHWVSKKNGRYAQQKDALTQKVVRQKKKETGAAKVGDNGLDPGDEASQGRIQKNMKRHAVEAEKVKPQALSVYLGETVPTKTAPPIAKRPKQVWSDELPQDHILTGGDVYTLGDAVMPGPLSAAVSLGGMSEPQFVGGQGKRRLSLAQWIVDPKNPLTARVMVNRVWSWHFGRGLAGNPNNFGGTGALPTHPELLDYLAAWFMDHGWSVKKLNELILSSRAYRRSSQHPDPDFYAELDSRQELYAAFLPRRLTAEELRDSFLAVSGELNPTPGGVPVRPDINMEVAFQPRQIMGGNASVYEPDPLPEQRNRRTIYTERQRGLRDPFLENFNQPGLDTSCELRETSTIAPQALTLFNAEEVHDRALAFADRLLSSHSSDESVIKEAFLTALGRMPTEQEIELCLEEWEVANREEAKTQPEPKSFPSQIERTVMAEKTGEPYTFVEHMPAYETYVPDLQRSETDARTRGLSHLCLVLFNLNEFVYLD